jgi:hypothetical protein
VPSRNNGCRGYTLRITHSECVYVGLIIQHEKVMRRVIMLSMACPAVHHFPTLSHKRHVFHKTNSDYVSTVLARCSLSLCAILQIVYFVM